MAVSKPVMTGQEVMARESLLDLTLVGVIRASGGGKPWVSIVRPVHAGEVDSMRHELEVRGTMSAQCDFSLDQGVNNGQNPVLVVCAKVDASPVSLFAFRQATVSEDGHLTKSAPSVRPCYKIYNICYNIG